MTAAAGDVLLTGILGLVHALREAGVPVSMVEAVDAFESLRHVRLEARDEFEVALATTLVKREQDLGTFRALYQARFGHGAAARAPEPGDPSPVASDVAEVPAREDLIQALLDALRQGDASALRALAALAVARFAGIGAEGDRQPGASERYYLYRVLRQVDLSNLLQRAWREGRPGEDGGPAMEARLLRDEQVRRVDELRRMIAEEIQGRLTRLRAEARASGPPAPAAAIEDTPFLGASPQELRLMQQAIRPLARKLAARIAQRRRRRRAGRLDVRKTLRRSLSTGGVLLDPAYRRPRISRPDLFLLCDVSGSVAEFAAFTLAFLTAMGRELSRLRSFAFVDGVDEVTEAFTGDNPARALRHLLARAEVVWADGHSDYGRVFRRFWDAYGAADLGPKTTLIITGDARNNHRDPGRPALQALRDRARRVFWLNPEPRRQWDTGDSIMGLYAPCCHGVFEASTLRQLAEAVLQIG